MARKKDGYDSRLYLGDLGGSTFSIIDGINTLDRTKTVNSDTFPILEDDGKFAPEVTTEEFEYTASGYVVPSSATQKQLGQISKSTDKRAHFRYYPNKSVLNEYVQFSAVISEISISSPADSKETLDITLLIDARSLVFKGVLLS